MKLEVTIDTEQFHRELELFAERFGETSRDAVARLAVRTGENCARLTVPRGLKEAQEKVINRVVERGLRQTVVVLRTKQTWKKVRKRPRPRLKYGGEWQYVRKDQFETSEETVAAHPDKFRRGKADPGRQPLGRRLIIWKALYTKAAKKRKLMVGTAKGAWWGAAQDAVRLQRGRRKFKPDKDVGKWIKRHAGRGSARWVRNSRRGPVIALQLVNPVSYTKNLFRQAYADRAVREAWEDTLKWYAATVKARESKR